METSSVREMIKLLARLLRAIDSAEFEYRIAVNETNVPILAGILAEKLEKRAHFSRQLRHLLEELGAEIPDKPSLTLKSRLHSLWMELEATLAKAPELALLAECELIDQDLLAAYGQVLDSGIVFPPRIEHLILEQSDQLRGDLEQLDEHRRRAACAGEADSE